MPPLEDVLSDPKAISVGVLLCGAVYAFMRELIVPGVTHRNALAAKDVQISKLEKDIVEYKQIIWRSLEITERTQKAKASVAE